MLFFSVAPLLRCSVALWFIFLQTTIAAQNSHGSMRGKKVNHGATEQQSNGEGVGIRYLVGFLGTFSAFPLLVFALIEAVMPSVSRMLNVCSGTAGQCGGIFIALGKTLPNTQRRTAGRFCRGTIGLIRFGEEFSGISSSRSCIKTEILYCKR
jgi:hypothetical protein